MITKRFAYQTSDGQTVATLEQAQQIELLILLEDEVDAPDAVKQQNRIIVGKLSEQAAKVVDILTMKENSRPKARKVNGGSRKPKFKDTPAAA